MAATYADLARLDAILKDRPIQDAIRKAINLATPFAEKITQQLSVSGRKGIFPVQFGVNEGIYARNEKEPFGISAVDSPDLAEVTPRYIYALFEITGQSMSMTRDTPGAFEEALALTLQNTIDGVKLDMARQIIGDGSGKIALIKSRTDADTFIVDSPFGIDRYKSSGPVRNILRNNMPLAIVDQTTVTNIHLTGNVSTVTHASTGSTIDFDNTEDSTAVDGDFVVRGGGMLGGVGPGSSATNNYGKEIQGWEAAVQTTGSYMGISRTGRENWQGVLVDAAGGGASTVALTPDVLRDTVDTVMERTGYSPEFLVMNYAQRRNMYNLFSAQIRYAPMVLPTGLRENTLQFDDMSVLVERFWPAEHIGLVNTSFWYHVMAKDTEWIPGQGGTVLHFSLNTDLFRAVMRTYRNMICLYPATQAHIYGLDN